MRSFASERSIMKRASDFRSLARGALTNNWGIAIAAGFIAGALGGGSSVGMPSISINFSGFTDFPDTDESIGIIGGADMATITAILIGVLAFVGVFSLIIGAVYFFLGSVVSVGYSKFNLELTDGETPKIKTLFAYFKNWSTAVVATLLTGIFVFLWSLLFIIPGIVAAYSYAMVPYILAENPGISAKDAINESKRIMRGNRWRLFCLHFSFIGWELLCILTCGFGFIVLAPYMAAADAAFYRDLVHREVEYTEIPNAEPTLEP